MTKYPNHIVPVPGTGSETHEGFGLVDSKRREFGMRVNAFTCTVVAGESPLEEGRCYVKYHATALEPGTWYRVYVHVTRGGQNYGASHRDQYFATEAERDAYIAKRRAAALKRAQPPRLNIDMSRTAARGTVGGR